MDFFLLNKTNIDSKTILHKNLGNMHVVLRNMHIAHVSILRPTYTGKTDWPFGSMSRTKIHKH